MDIQRLKRLSGQYSSLSEMWKEVKVDTNVDKSMKAARSKAKENNAEVKNSNFDKVDLGDQETAAELVDTDDSTITPKEGKKDAAGQKADSKAKGERQFHTVVIGDNGAPNVSDSTTIDTVDVETWGEGYVVASSDAYITEYTQDNIIGGEKLNDAVFFKTQEMAEAVAAMFEDVEVRKVTAPDPFLSESSVHVVVDSPNEEVVGSMKDFLKDHKGVSIGKHDHEGETQNVMLNCTDDCDVDAVCSALKKKFKDEIKSCKVMKESVEDLAVDASFLSEGMKEELEDRLKQGEEIQVALQSRGEVFSGYIKQVRDKMLHVQPTEKTRERFKTQERTVVIPTDVESLQWSEKHANRVVGRARELSFNKPDNDMKNPFMKNRDQDAMPQKGKADDPSTWAIDMSSWNGPEGSKLTEMVKKMRHGG